MLFGLDGVEIGLLIVFLCLFGAILSGFPVAFAIAGAGVVSFTIIAALDSAGILVHQALDTASPAYQALIEGGANPGNVSVFTHPDLPRAGEALFPRGWEVAIDRNLSFIVNRINQRVLAGQSIETLLAVLMFVMMGITLERSRIAEDLLTTMARVFGPLPGGLAVSVVVVGALLAASTGIVGATVVTMGLLSLPTMLRSGYSPQLSTGVIAASGTLGQIIPPSIVIVLLGTLAGDIYAGAQETRAQLAGCADALTYLGEAAVLSVGTLFQSALLPGVMLAVLYGAYAFGVALLDPARAPSVPMADRTGPVSTREDILHWVLIVPAGLVGAAILAGALGLAGSQSVEVSSFTTTADTAELRTDVSDACKASMIELHGQEKWDRAVAEQQALRESGAETVSEERSAEEVAAARADAIATAPPVSGLVVICFLLLALVISAARGIKPMDDPRPLIIGAAGAALAIAADTLFIAPTDSPGTAFLWLAVPIAMALHGARHGAMRLAENDLIRVVFPPLVLIVAVLGSILGGITNPTPAAALGAGGAIMLAAYRRLRDEERSPRLILMAGLSILLMILIGIEFDLRIDRESVPFEDWVAFIVALAAYHVAFIGLIYACWVLLRGGILTPVVRETAKVTSMVFTILIGSQLLNLVVISFGGEDYIQDFLRSFDQETTVFLVVMLVLFVLGFVLDFLEIIYIVVPIVGPVIYGGSFEPEWVTIMIAINLQTSFLTPPFGFALFYLRGVAPPEVSTVQIYRGIIPFVAIQVLGLAILWFFPGIVTIVPDLIPN